MDSDARNAARERLVVLGEISTEIAHELRNVLQVISSSAYVVRHEMSEGRPEVALAHAIKIEKNAREGHGIVDDLMALARGEALRAESVALADVIVVARADFGAGCAQWEDAIDPSDLHVKAHAGLFVRLLRGLYENAIQACAPRAPLIATRGFQAESGTVIEVADDGPGVAREIAARAFEPLVTARDGGTGLGLPLARRIAEAHGGTLMLVDGEGGGATFRIDLPRIG